MGRFPASASLGAGAGALSNSIFKVYFTVFIRFYSSDNSAKLLTFLVLFSRIINSNSVICIWSSWLASLNPFFSQVFSCETMFMNNWFSIRSCGSLRLSSQMSKLWQVMRQMLISGTRHYKFAPVHFHKWWNQTLEHCPSGIKNVYNAALG